MKKLVSVILLALVVMLASSASADTTYNNFAGYQPYWHPLGNPNTATYGETFTAPTNGDNVLQSVSFYMAGPAVAGDIKMSAYIATWTGTNAGALLYTSAPIDYANTGNAQLSFNVGGLSLTPGGSYLAFLSVSQYYGQSTGLSYISQGDPTIPGGNFVYYNNGGDFSALFSPGPGWAIGLKPDWAITAEFNNVPEPGTLTLLGSGLIGLAGVLRRKLSL